LQLRYQNAIAELQEEKRLFLAFREKGGHATKRKLSFGEHAEPKMHNAANMAINEHAV